MFVSHRTAGPSLHQTLGLRGHVLALSAIAMVITVSLVGLPARAEPERAISHYRLMCDASTGVAAGEDMFVVANDEDTVLRVYRRRGPGEPVDKLDVAAALGIVGDKPEADLEGSAWLDGRVYWITSHGANKNGKPRPDRRRLFATEVVTDGGAVTMKVVGTPYKNLVEDLVKSPQLQKYQLGKAAEKAPEEPGALNIEGLCATRDGKLLIGFRNPIPDDKALLVPLENPQEVMRGQPAALGTPTLLPLGGRGIRSIEYDPRLNSYLIIAGHYADQSDFKLFRWSGDAKDSPQPVEHVTFEGVTPEGMIIYPGELKQVQIVSDDGDERVGDDKCKDAAEERKSFRSFLIEP